MIRPRVTTGKLSILTLLLMAIKMLIEYPSRFKGTVSMKGLTLDMYDSVDRKVAENITLGPVYPFEE